MKVLAPVPSIPGARAGKRLRKYGDIRNVTQKVFAPPLSLIGFACSAKPPTAEGKMIGAIVSNHVRLDCPVTRLVVSGIEELDKAF
jgi:hypothetical protein